MILIGLFLISLILIIAMISYRVVKIRRGEIAVGPNFYEKGMFWPDDLNLRSLKNNVLEYSKKALRLLVLFLLRVWIKSVYLIHRKKEILMPKIKALWSKIKTKKIKNNPTVSGFLQNISEYKSKLKTMSDKIKEEENGLK